ncbi:MAG TPA: FtsX-like permease family protein, partial [Bacillota bacterium]|nr:FtsX-like permease family protein [Bacillota bacterium]
AKPAWLVKLFLLKSIFIGLAGGVIGYILGTLLAVFLGPQLAGIAVLPLPALGLYGLGISLLISVFASILPVMKAVKIDPSVIMQEE